MRGFVVFATILALGAAKSVSLLKREQLTDEMINDPRYLLWETEEGLFEVEDLYSNETANAEVFASERDVSFYIFTKRNSITGIPIRESQLHNLVRLTGFDIKKSTLVIIHGWKNHVGSPINRFIRNAILANNDINVIVVDWSRIARKAYVIAQASVLAVGNYVGDFLLRMDDELGHSLHKVTIVGHSLGAHISGNVGARTKGLIETIIGLDPAGPLFTRRNTDNRLDPTDAKYVHVMHTNDGTLGFGIIMGHADYYPNGGSTQPGCGIDIAGACAHNRAFRYFAESFDNNNFVAKRCDTYRNYNRNRCNNNPESNMGGYPVVEAVHGEYYLDTNRKSPYARG